MDGWMDGTAYVNKIKIGLKKAYMTNSIKAYIIKIQDKSFVAQWCNG